jgi:2-polyprenyl-3-methyl-5-hydroxy-6-metoxy-1,4-benzoquinol methylase
MGCCQPHAGAAGRFFSWFAGRSGRHYRKKGLGRLQQELASAIEEAGIDGVSLLEIGCGVGYLHQSLLKRGAARATGVDLSEKMLAEARVLAAEQSLGNRTDYVLGDFVAIAGDLPRADVTILDKVVCCYPDARTLVDRSLDKTKTIYALTYPRGHMLNRIMTSVEAICLKLIRCDFRPYVHDPESIERWIEARGFRKREQRTGWIWLTQVYAR